MTKVVTLGPVGFNPTGEYDDTIEGKISYKRKRNI